VVSVSAPFISAVLLFLRNKGHANIEVFCSISLAEESTLIFDVPRLFLTKQGGIGQKMDAFVSKDSMI